MVQGTIRVLRESCDVVDMHVRAIQADVMEHVVEGRVGWDLDAYGQGLGRHFDNKYQDPSLVKPDLPGRFCRTTLIEGDDKKWYVVELCERLDGLIQYDAEFYEMSCKRNIITILTDGEKDPLVMVTSASRRHFLSVVLNRALWSPVCIYIYATDLSSIYSHVPASPA